MEYLEGRSLAGVPVSMLDRAWPLIEERYEIDNAGVIALDMETSLVHVLGHCLGVATASLCLITNNADPFQIIDNDQRVHGETMLIRSVLDALTKWAAS